MGDINACFAVTSVVEEGDGFYLNDNKLSQQVWNLKYKPILERFSITYQYGAENYNDQKITDSNLTDYHVDCKNSSSAQQIDPIHELENYIAVFYPGVLTWHQHRHLNRSWSDTRPIIYRY